MTAMNNVKCVTDDHSSWEQSCVCGDTEGSGISTAPQNDVKITFHSPDSSVCNERTDHGETTSVASSRSDELNTRTQSAADALPVEQSAVSCTSTMAEVEDVVVESPPRLTTSGDDELSSSSERWRRSPFRNNAALRNCLRTALRRKLAARRGAGGCETEPVEELKDFLRQHSCTGEGDYLKPSDLKSALRLRIGRAVPERQTFPEQGRTVVCPKQVAQACVDDVDRRRPDCVSVLVRRFEDGVKSNTLLAQYPSSVRSRTHLLSDEYESFAIKRRSPQDSNCVGRRCSHESICDDNARPTQFMVRANGEIRNMDDTLPSGIEGGECLDIALNMVTTRFMAPLDDAVYFTNCAVNIDDNDDDDADDADDADDVVDNTTGCKFGGCTDSTVNCVADGFVKDGPNTNEDNATMPDDDNTYTLSPTNESERCGSFVAFTHLVSPENSDQSEPETDTQSHKLMRSLSYNTGINRPILFESYGTDKRRGSLNAEDVFETGSTCSLLRDVIALEIRSEKVLSNIVRRTDQHGELLEPTMAAVVKCRSHVRFDDEDGNDDECISDYLGNCRDRYNDLDTPIGKPYSRSNTATSYHYRSTLNEIISDCHAIKSILKDAGQSDSDVDETSGQHSKTCVRPQLTASQRSHPRSEYDAEVETSCEQSATYNAVFGMNGDATFDSHMQCAYACNADSSDRVSRDVSCLPEDTTDQPSRRCRRRYSRRAEEEAARNDVSSSSVCNTLLSALPIGDSSNDGHSALIHTAITKMSTTAETCRVGIYDAFHHVNEDGTSNELESRSSMTSSHRSQNSNRDNRNKSSRVCSAKIVARCKWVIDQVKRSRSDISSKTIRRKCDRLGIKTKTEYDHVLDSENNTDFNSNNNNNDQSSEKSSLIRSSAAKLLQARHLPSKASMLFKRSHGRYAKTMKKTRAYLRRRSTKEKENRLEEDDPDDNIRVTMALVNENMLSVTERLRNLHLLLGPREGAVQLPTSDVSRELTVEDGDESSVDESSSGPESSRTTVTEFRYSDVQLSPSHRCCLTVPAAVSVAEVATQTEAFVPAVDSVMTRTSAGSRSVSFAGEVKIPVSPSYGTFVITAYNRSDAILVSYVDRSPGRCLAPLCAPLTFVAVTAACVACFAGCMWAGQRLSDRLGLRWLVIVAVSLAINIFFLEPLKVLAVASYVSFYRNCLM